MEEMRKMAERFAGFVDYINEHEDDRNVLTDLYSTHSKPKFGTISTWDDLEVALMQRMSCASCSECYWGGSNGGECDPNAVNKEIKRVFAIYDGKKTKKKAPQPDPTAYIACECCAYATQTNPRICMNPKSIAKHSYVNNTSYCDQFTP